jgi:hypothetical protein
MALKTGEVCINFPFRPPGTREVVSLNISSVTTTSKRKQIHSELQQTSAERKQKSFTETSYNQLLSRKEGVYKNWGFL